MTDLDARSADLETLIDAIRFPTELPEAALRELVRREDTSAPALVKLLEDSLEGEIDHEDQGIPYAMLLLAQMDHEPAFPALASLARHPQVADLLGDMVTEVLGRCLACCAGKDSDALMDLVRDTTMDEVLRNQAVTALICLAAGGRLPREKVLADLKILLGEALDADSPEMAAAVVVGFLDFPCDSAAEALVRQAYADLLDEDIYPIEDFEETVAQGPEGTWAALQADDRFIPVVDAVLDSSWWACWDPDFDPED